MKLCDDLIKNDVPAMGQLAGSENIAFCLRDKADLKILFVGNSITRHGPAAQIGWHGDWGMAASSAENDYVHRVVRALEQDGHCVSYGLVNVSEWEQSWNDAALFSKYTAARDFAPDILVMRLGENAKLMDRAQEFMLHYRTAIAYFASKSTRVVLTDLFWQYEPFDTAICALAERNGYDFAPLHDLGEREEMKALGKFEHAGVAVHPSDEGMRAIAERIYAAVVAAMEKGV